MSVTVQHKPGPGLFCPSGHWTHLASFDAPPPGETDFGIPDYHRSLWQSDDTGHIVNLHAMDLESLYDSGYWDRTYPDGILPVFERIMGLPPDRSDNRQRVARIEAFWRASGGSAPRTVLDVGSGLAVFPAAMQGAGWSCTALDPDPRATRHAEDAAGVDVLTGDFMSVAADRQYGLVTLNKVLEHVEDMVGMLDRARAFLVPGGWVYVEVPDGEAAIAAGPEREEFFVEHYAAFSMASLALLCHRAGYRTDLIERVIEPSGKYTLRAFLCQP